MRRRIAVAVVLLLSVTAVVVASILWTGHRQERTTAAIIQDIHAQNIVDAYLLAFIAEDYRSVRPGLALERALLVIEYRSGKWQLLHVYREPGGNRNHRRWQVVIALDAYVASQEYDHRPTRAEVELFIKDKEWNFKPDLSYRLLHGEVYSDTWYRALGYQPDYKF